MSETEAIDELDEDEEIYIPAGSLAVQLSENAEGASDNEEYGTEIDATEVLLDDSVPAELGSPVLLKTVLEHDYSKVVLPKTADRISSQKKNHPVSQRYIEDFIYSDAITENQNESSSSAITGTPLTRFPKISKAIESCSVETIDTLYQLLFLSSALNSRDILEQRILNFSGFDCEENSDDHFNREMMLHSLPDEMLLNIAAILNIEHIQVKPEYFEKEKARLVSLIMKFLNKPQGRRKLAQEKRLASGTEEPKVTKTPVKKRRKKKTLSPRKSKEPKKEALIEKISNKMTYILPRPKSTDKGNAKVSDSKAESNETTQSSVEAETKDDSKSPEDVPKQEEPDTTKKKLKDYPTVTKTIRRSPEELLLDIHFLLFNEGGEIYKLKRNILEFEGFTFEVDSEEHDERRDFLERMSDKTVDDVAKAFCLDIKSNKEETMSHILAFLRKPDESYINTEANAGDSSGLSDIDELDIEEMFESDDSVTCEVVSKKVECIDLLSSGEDSEKEIETIKTENAKNPIIVSVMSTPTFTTTSTSSPQPPKSGNRTLKNFETIGKIVNTHPDEYLVDIYDLLYLKKHNPRTLREEILSFSGFDFHVGSTEYVKRKLLLDRMGYNNVRRIYNTLIHVSTEVKMYSKPAMITDIFDFLLKLPDVDTSIINLQKRVSKPYPLTVPRLASSSNSSSSAVKVPTSVVMPPVNIISQPGKLSDLKRVFQRVSCFPCEYLIDVHKLLFMTDCDTKVIRQNIFAFKGFNFSVDSSEFQQRKMYLEYLTFHSLRKISSVLTTKTVDLRNSTKHELASHLTEVLAEYTNLNFDNAEASATSQQPTSTMFASTSGIPPHADPAVEQIVVTPSIENLCHSPTPSCPNPNSILKTYSGQHSKFITEIKSEPEVQSQTSQVTVTSRQLTSNVTTAAAVSYERKRKAESLQGETQYSSSPVQNESYQDMYGQGLNIYTSNIHCFPQTTTVPIIYTLPVQTQVHNQGYTGYPAEPVSPSSSFYPGDMLMPVECILTEEPVVESTTKKAKLSPSVTKKNVAPPMKSKSSDNSKSSLHDKIRDAMNDMDEEECDKPLASFLGHPNDRILKQQICDIVEQTDLQDITINTVIQKIFSMYPKFDLNYRKEYIKSTLRSVLYRLGAPKNNETQADSVNIDSPDCSVSTTFSCENPEQSTSPPVSS